MAENSELWQVIPRLAGARVLIVGDVMLDRFVSCVMERVSPEAPVPVLRHEAESVMLGGAGNVAANIRSLSAAPTLLGLIGTDAEGEHVSRLCSANGIDNRWLVRCARRPTSLKTRFVAKGQQVLRYDREAVGATDADERDGLAKAFDFALDAADIVILSDYAKGTLSNGLCAELIQAARKRGLPVVVDPKGGDYSRYQGATVIKPNLKELADATGRVALDEPAIVAAAAGLVDRLGLEALVVSRGPAGISVIRSNAAVHIPTVAREVFDEAGAGDTVVAVLALGLAAGFDVETAAHLANAAAGVVVGKHGTAQVTQAELIQALGAGQGSSRRQGGTVSNIVPRGLIGPLTESWRADRQRIGFTNGCFDILHAGHVALLEHAKSHCDRLVVGLNSDESVRRLKGPTRPINGETARARVLAALNAVDAVVVFGEDTPAALIETLAPDVLVKGADYAIEDVVGADFVLARGGSVELVPLVSGHSTSNIVATIGQANRVERA